MYTLLYASICFSKIEHLEKYVQKQAPTFHKTVFDIAEWEPVLRIAKEHRLKELNQLKMELNAQRNAICQSLYQSYIVLRSYRQEIDSFKSTVRSEIAELQQLFTSSNQQIKQAISRFVLNQKDTEEKLRLEATKYQKEARKVIETP